MASEDVFVLTEENIILIKQAEELIEVYCKKSRKKFKTFEDKFWKIDYLLNSPPNEFWSLDEGYNVLTVHITLKETLSMEKLTELKNRIRTVLKEEEIQHATIEFETPNELCVFENCV